jgi:hypothetical protein
MLGWLASPDGRDEHEFTSTLLTLLPPWLADDEFTMQGTLNAKPK